MDLALNNLQWLMCHKTKPNLVHFRGLQITSSGMTPSKNFLNTITNFPIPKNITDTSLG